MKESLLKVYAEYKQKFIDCITTGLKLKDVKDLHFSPYVLLPVYSTEKSITLKEVTDLIHNKKDNEYVIRLFVTDDNLDVEEEVLSFDELSIDELYAIAERI